MSHFWAQKAKNCPKNQNCKFSTIFCVENYFAHNFLQFTFLNGNHTSLDFFSLKNVLSKKYFPNFIFKNFPLVPPMDVFSSFGGPRVVAADLSCSRVASVHCDFVGVWGGTIFWPEKGFFIKSQLVFRWSLDTSSVHTLNIELKIPLFSTEIAISGNLHLWLGHLTCSKLIFYWRIGNFHISKIIFIISGEHYIKKSVF